MTTSSGSAGVLVDVDGTLLDTNYLHTLAWARAFADVGVWAPMNAIHRLVGMGGDQLVPELFGADIEQAHDAYSVRFADLKGDAHAFPGAASLLRSLHDSGLVVVLATSAAEEDLADMRKVLDADDAIDAVVHAGLVKRSKPAPDIFTAALERGAVDPRRAFAIGDTVWDVQGARAARLGCITVESGGFSRHELAEAGAVCVYRDVEELGDQLRTGPIAALLAP